MGRPEPDPQPGPRGFSKLRPTSSAEPGGGRTWWAHFEFTRINIEPIILKNKIEELMNVRGVGEKNFLKLKPQITVGAKGDGVAAAKP